MTEELTALELADELDRVAKWSDSEHWGTLNEAAAKLRHLHEEVTEQGRLLSMSAERELALLARIDRLEKLNRKASMTREDIIAMARKVWSAGEVYVGPSEKTLEEFAALVAAKASAVEREKSLRLWMLLDDVDTADDIAKSDDAVYRSLCRQAHQKRWAVMTGDELAAAIRAKGETK